MWMGTIYAVSAQPSLPSVPGLWDLLLKKLMHAAAYGVLALLILRALRGTWSHEGPIRWASCILSLAYALSDEYHQTFVPGRNGNLVDVAVDAAGIAAAMVFDWRLRAKLARVALASRSESAQTGDPGERGPGPV